jgi:hypothetical protein
MRRYMVDLPGRWIARGSMLRRGGARLQTRV